MIIALHCVSYYFVDEYFLSSSYHHHPPHISSHPFFRSSSSFIFSTMARLRLLSSRRKQIRLALKATMRLLTVAALYIYISLQIIGAAGKRKSAAEWNTVVNKNLDAVEESWKKGDAIEELKTEDMYEYERMEARRNSPMEVPSHFDENQAQDYFKHAKAQSGPTMVFARLNRTLKDGSKLTKEATEETGAMWRELLFLGGVEVTPYAVEYDTLLMTVQRGWNGDELRDFLLSKEEVIEVEWDQVKYKPERLKTLEEKQEEKRRKKKSRKKKKKKKEKKKKKKGKKNKKDEL